VTSYEDATKMSRVLGDFPVQLATRLPDWSASGLPFVRLSCRSPHSTSPTHTICCGHVSDTPHHLDIFEMV